MTLTLTLPDGIEPEEARLLLATKLFEDGRVSLGRAAEVAGYSKATFAELLSRRGVAVIDYPPDDLNTEVELDIGGG